MMCTLRHCAVSTAVRASRQIASVPFLTMGFFSDFFSPGHHKNSDSREKSRKTRFLFWVARSKKSYFLPLISLRHTVAQLVQHDVASKNNSGSIDTNLL